jgi:DNA invertase Pin-like site-specific DNA recombinase
VSTSRCVAYYRVSTKAQGHSGLGLDAQEQAVTHFLDGRGSQLVGTYTDIETGTRKGNDRPQLARAIAQCKRERATLVIAKLDRLSRNVHFVSGMMESGVDFVAVDVPSANRLTIHILAAVAEEEARMISRRTKDALAAAKARGVKLGRPENLPADANARSARVIQDNAERAYANITPIVLGLRSQGLPFGKIAAQLNAKGERTRRGAEFTPTTVIRIVERSGRGT